LEVLLHTKKVFWHLFLQAILAEREFLVLEAVDWAAALVPVGETTGEEFTAAGEEFAAAGEPVGV